MMGGLSVWHWLIVLLVVILVFGTKKLGNMGGDIGKAVKGFKDRRQDHDRRRHQGKTEVLMPARASGHA